MSTLEVSGKPYTMPELLAYWISEREMIRKVKEAGAPKPWTEDPVFQIVYFCNVHREDDKTTKWIRNYYTVKRFGNSYELAICAARLFNWPDTLAEIGYFLVEKDFHGLKLKLEERKYLEHKIWSGAYLITTHGRKMPKIDYCVEILEAASKVLPLKKSTCKAYHEDIMKLEGYGSFLAAQVVADLKNTPEHWLYNSKDWKTFSAPGPGSMRGLGWYFDCKVPIKQYEEFINKIAEDLRWDHCMQDLQNCLCEFDKYCRVSTGVGRSKRKYPGVRSPSTVDRRVSNSKGRG